VTWEEKQEEELDLLAEKLTEAFSGDDAFFAVNSMSEKDLDCGFDIELAKKLHYKEGKTIREIASLFGTYSSKIFSGFARHKLIPLNGVDQRRKRFRKYVYNNIVFKSSWEIEVAKWLDSRNIEWVYEPRVFELSNDTRYIPDFFLPKFGFYVEVKGYLRAISAEKMSLFVKLGYDLRYIDDIKNISLDEKWRPR